MTTTPGGPAIDGRQQEKEPPLTTKDPSPFRNLTSAVKRPFTRSFEDDENFELPDIPDAVKPVAQSQMEELGSWPLYTRLETTEID